MGKDPFPGVIGYCDEECFLPRTTFFCIVRAAELRPGQLLLGPDGRQVRVASVRKHPAAPRPVVKFRTEGMAHDFIIATDHSIRIKEPEGAERHVDAGTVFAMWTSDPTPPSIFDGYSYKPVEYASVGMDNTALVEVSFDKSADEVLAWLPPKRAPRGVGQRAINFADAVTCLGESSAMEGLTLDGATAPGDAMTCLGESSAMAGVTLEVARSFLNVRMPESTTSRRRSLSEGATPRDPARP